MNTNSPRTGKSFNMALKTITGLYCPAPVGFAEFKAAHKPLLESLFLDAMPEMVEAEMTFDEFVLEVQEELNQASRLS